MWGAVKTMTCDTFVKTHRMYEIKSKPTVNWGLWLLMMCPHRFMGDQWTTLVWESDGGGSYAYVRAGHVVNSHILSFELCSDM